MLIDFLVLAPIVAIHIWAGSDSRTAAMALLVPFACVHVGYFVYSHGQFGQTIGKHLVDIRIVKRNGDIIGWTEAWLRSSFDVLFAALSCVARMQRSGIRVHSPICLSIKDASPAQSTLTNPRRTNR